MTRTEIIHNVIDSNPEYIGNEDAIKLHINNIFKINVSKEEIIKCYDLKAKEQFEGDYYESSEDKAIHLHSIGML